MITVQKIMAERWGNIWGNEDDPIRRWWIWIGLFVALWAAEWTWIQALTIPTRPITRHPFLIPTLRACFDVLWALVLVMLIPRLWGLVTVTIMAGISALGLIIYSQYFKSPLAIVESVGLLFGPTARVIPYAVSSVSPLIMGGLIGIGVIKIYLLKKAQPYTPEWRLRWKGLGFAGVAGLILIVGLQWTTYSFPRMALQPFSRQIYAYGYLISWSHKTYLRADSQKFLEKAKAEFTDYSDQTILRMDDPKRISSPLVIVQVESLGFEMLDHRVALGEVVPFINRLKEQSLLYRIRAYHNYGSGGMDFTCLSGGRPSSYIMNYELTGFEYTNSFPLFLKKHGYRTGAYHGNTGDFYDRRTAFQKMKFDRLGFKEDLNPLHMTNSYWGIRDRDILMRVAAEVTGATGRYFAFVITLDSHMPFDLIRPEEALLFPGAIDMTERYINSIHWVDRMLEQFYQALPVGTTLLIYGDHTAKSKIEGMQTAPDLTGEYVPAILHRKGEDWSPTQRKRAWSRQTDSLTLLDVMAYVRAGIDAETPVAGRAE